MAAALVLRRLSALCQALADEEEAPRDAKGYGRNRVLSFVVDSESFRGVIMVSVTWEQ